MTNVLRAGVLVHSGDLLDRPWITLAARWLLIVVAAALAFHSSVVVSVYADLQIGAGLAYLVAVPAYALFAAAATGRHGRTSRDIHDRETDAIVGGVALLLAVAAPTLLGPQLAGVYYLWRIDLLMCWLFLFGGTVLLFGLRRTMHYREAWLVLALLWPLPIRIVTNTIGLGSAIAQSAVQVLVILALIMFGRRPGEPRPWRTTLLAAGVSAVLAVFLDLEAHPWRMLVPPLAALAVGVGSWLLHDRSRVRPTLARPVVRQPRASALLLALAAAVGYILLPEPPQPLEPSHPVGITAQQPGSEVPPDWTTLSTADFTGGPSRYFGYRATWERYVVRAADPAAGPYAVDGGGLAREMVIDVLTTERPRTLRIYPVVTTYPMGTLQLTPAAQVDLGHGVTGQLYGAVDDRRRLTWTLLTFTWAVPANLVWSQPEPDDPDVLTQRITLMTVDDHRPGAPFPEPSNALLSSVRAAIVGILRGSRSTVSSADPKDVELLLHAGRQLVVSRLEAPA